MKKEKQFPYIIGGILAAALVICAVSLVSLSGSNSSINNVDKDFAYLKEDTFVMLNGEESNFGQAVTDLTEQADAYMKELGVSSSDRKLVCEDLKEQLYKGQDETEKRILGDHGIRHVLTNWQKAKAYLDSRGDCSTETYLAVLVAEVYHDVGYDVYPCNLPMLDSEYSNNNHDLNSAVIEEHDDTYSVYERIFSQDTLKSLLNAVRTHNAKDEETIVKNTSVDSDVIALAINLSDKCALSLREKVPSVLDNCPQAYKDFLAGYPYVKAEDSEVRFAKTMETFVEDLKSANLDSHQLEDYLYLVDTDMKPAQIKYDLRLLFCYQPEDGIQYNAETGENDILLYRVSYGIDGEEAIQRNVIPKLFEDLIAKEEGEDIDTYDACIAAIYDAACEEGGYTLDDGRGLHFTIKEIPVEEIPGSGLDYLLYKDSIVLF